MPKSKKPQRVKPESTDDSDSDDVDLFTTSFMSKVKELKPSSHQLKLTHNENDESDSDDDSDENNYSKGHELFSEDRVHDVGASHRTLEGQSLAAEEEDSSSQAESSSSGEEDSSSDDQGDSGESDSDEGEGLEEGEGSEEDVSEDKGSSEEDIDSDNSAANPDAMETSDTKTDTTKSKKKRKQVIDNTGDVSSVDDDVSEASESNASDDNDEDISKKAETAPSKTGTFEDLRKELADVPFSELQLLKEKIGIKAYNKAMFGTRDQVTDEGKRSFKRENKNRPMEMSSKRQVPRYREVIQVKKKTFRDPRFDDLSGEYDDRLFKQFYSFIGDVKQREKQKLIKRYQKETDEEKKEQIHGLIKRINQQEKTDMEKEKRNQKESERKKKEIEQIKQGKKPYFMKKADQKKLELAEKYRELKKSGKVDNYMAKKRKKTASKDRKHLPNKHYVFS